MRDAIAIIVFAVVLFFVAFHWLVPAMDRAEKEDIQHTKFEGRCDYLGGHVASFDEGETLLCIKGGKVVSRG
jgi:hypothetical protein